MISLTEIARALGGRVEGGQVRAPGPGRPRSDRSLSVRLSAKSADGFVVHSHSTRHDWQECRDYVADALGLSRDRWQDKREPDPIERMQRRFAIRRAQEAERAETEARILRARALWQQAVDPVGTVVERYLASRGLTLDDQVAGHALRFHPACPFAGERLPTMIAAMRAIEGDAVQAIHRTALTPAGEKIDRMMLGPVGGTAVKLDADEGVTTGLAIGEGIETCLAARQLGIRPAWALGSVGAIRAFPVLPGIETLTILCERDENGASEAAAQACGERWHAAGRRVTLARPSIGSDMNDVLRGVRA